MAKPDPQAVRDMLVEDAVKPAHEQGRAVNVEAAQKYFSEVLDTMDLKAKDAKQATDVQSKTDAGTGDEFKARTGEQAPDAWRVAKRQDQHSAFIHQDRLKMVGQQLMRNRMRWIAARPDLYEQVKGLSLALNSANKGVRERAAIKMREFIEKTNRLAGHDWRKPPPTKRHFG